MTEQLESKRLKKYKESSAKRVKDALFDYDGELIIKYFKNRS